MFCNAQYRPEMQGIDVPGGIYAHIAGIDVVRAGAGEFYVLEDNLRVPSGVSYMLEDREMMMRLFPELFARTASRRSTTTRSYCSRTCAAWRRRRRRPAVVLLTPGAHNSAYFEHAFLAQQMGIELVEGQDLFVRDDFVYMRTTQGPQRVDVIYRRIDDDFLDPLVFRPDSMLGVPGLMAAYRAGHVTIANAIGTGIADDKSIYPYVPDMIRFYLGEEPLLANVPTWILRRKDDLAYALEHLDELVVKEVHGAGGYGMLIGPTASEDEREDFRARINATPEKYIAQPTLALSTCPTFVEQGVAPRHIDLRPFVLSGKEVTHRARRPDARGAARRLAGGELLAGRRHQGHLGAGGLMLSRTADHLYWMGRYVERAENLARMLDVHTGWRCCRSERPVRRTAGRTCCARWAGGRLRRAHDGIEPHWVIDFLVFDPGNPSASYNCLRAARENARAVRGAISSEMWETFNVTWLEMRASGEPLHRAGHRGVRRLGEAPRAPGARRGPRLDAARRGATTS